MNYAAEMGSGAMTYVPSFTKPGSGIRKMKGEGGFTDTHDGERICLLS
jgi:hypothetical protein